MKKLRVSSKRIDDDLLTKKRREELDKWPTGKEVDFEEVFSITLLSHHLFSNADSRSQMVRATLIPLPMASTISNGSLQLPTA